jgi:predicted DsbA family dithiol-disulfide isomerase
MRIQIDVWSDYVCPFCYLEAPVLKRLAAEYGDGLTIRWRAFELRPFPVTTLDPNGTYLRDIWARAVYPMAKERGMTLRLPPVQPRSRLAHEAAVFAGTHGLFDAMHSELFKAFFEDGNDIGDLCTLLEVGERIGLKPEQLRDALEHEHEKKRVLADEELALKLRISGVPAMFVHADDEPLGHAILVAGAQSLEHVRVRVNEVRRRRFLA